MITNSTFQMNKILNTTLKFLKNPNNILIRLNRYFKIHKSKEYYQSIRNMHKGRRGFVIGNGPSLLIDDLNLLSTASISLKSGAFDPNSIIFEGVLAIVFLINISFSISLIYKS